VSTPTQHTQPRRPLLAGSHEPAHQPAPLQISPLRQHPTAISTTDPLHGLCKLLVIPSLWQHHPSTYPLHLTPLLALAKPTSAALPCWLRPAPHSLCGIIFITLYARVRRPPSNYARASSCVHSPAPCPSSLLAQPCPGLPLAALSPSTLAARQHSQHTPEPTAAGAISLLQPTEPLGTTL